MTVAVLVGTPDPDPRPAHRPDYLRALDARPCPLLTSSTTTAYAPVVIFTPSSPLFPRLLPSPGAPTMPVTETPTTSEVRAWAQAHGHKVGARGVIPAKVVDAWNEAHPQRTYTRPAKG